jgi:hypothetical protein
VLSAWKQNCSKSYSPQKFIKLWGKIPALALKRYGFSAAAHDLSQLGEREQKA